MVCLFIFNDSPYGTQHTYNGLRLALNLSKPAANKVQIFLLGDGVLTGLGQPSALNAFYNVQEMLKQLVQKGAEIAACRTCLEARGLGDEMLLEGVKRSTLDELSSWTEEADKVLSF
jgi:uncharacterized protein involved in oxidation of intracellular sulfur